MSKVLGNDDSGSPQQVKQQSGATLNVAKLIDAEIASLEQQNNQLYLLLQRQYAGLGDRARLVKRLSALLRFCNALEPKELSERDAMLQKLRVINRTFKVESTECARYANTPYPYLADLLKEAKDRAQTLLESGVLVDHPLVPELQQTLIKLHARQAKRIVSLKMKLSEQLAEHKSLNNKFDVEVLKRRELQEGWAKQKKAEKKAARRKRSAKAAPVTQEKRVKPTAAADNEACVARIKQLEAQNKRLQAENKQVKIQLGDTKRAYAQSYCQLRRYHSIVHGEQSQFSPSILRRVNAADQPGAAVRDSYASSTF